MEISFASVIISSTASRFRKEACNSCCSRGGTLVLVIMDSETTNRLKMQSKASNELFRLFGSGKVHELEKLAVYGAEKWLDLNPSAKTECKYLAQYLSQYGEDSFLFDGIQNKNRYARVKRLRDRVSQYVKDGHGYFITLTFRDDVLEETGAHTRRRYVQRWCNKWLNSYVANIDFGGKKGREHYHCIGDGETYLDDKVSFKWASKDWFERYGAIQIERIHPCKSNGKNPDSSSYDISITRTCKYITKLTSHAIKETTGKAWNLLYSSDGGTSSKKYIHNLYEECYDFENDEWVECFDTDTFDWSHWDD